jgi:hypothetical protein
MKIYEKIPRDEWGVPLFRSNTREAEIKHDALGDPIVKVPGEKQLMRNFKPDPIEDPGPADERTGSNAIREILKKHGDVIVAVFGREFIDELLGRDEVAESFRRNKFESFGPAPPLCLTSECFDPLSLERNR